MATNTHREYTYTFLEEYISDISPKLKEIDLMIKSAEQALSVEETADVLSISEEEVFFIMKQHQINSIDEKTFFTIMENGSSKLCKLYKRELDCGSPYIYTREDISYIYDIHIDQVNKACNDLKLKEVTTYMMPTLFSIIPSHELNDYKKTLR